MTLADLREDQTRKKQLGQYFTGRPVGRLLAALAGAEDARSIIDPMVGSGDLLAACLEVGAKPESLVGLDLDPKAIEQAHLVLADRSGTDLVAVDAFSAKLPRNQFDLVITNPPYIRYQSRGQVDGVSVPSAVSVRNNLLRQIEGRGELTNEMRALLFRAAHEYPGTSDIAVPAWILSAALVREGGVLAVVAPQAWLNRNYAHVVRDLLDNAFDVEMLVEDGDASWFDDAQVRTNLVIARRRPVGVRGGQSVIVARATREMDTNGSLLGARRSEHAVVAALRGVSSVTPVVVTRGLVAQVTRNVQFAARQGSVLPPRLAKALSEDTVAPPFRTLESYGWRCGQGLRTGANDFFYLKESDGQVQTAARWGSVSVDVPVECLEPVVRRQSDLGEDFDVTDQMPLPSRVLNLNGWVTQSDKKCMGDAEVRVLPASLGRWIAHVAKSPLSDAVESRKFPELVAVATNAKTDRSGKPLAFWYQLPPLARRHKPALFMPRVCGGRPVAYMNSAGVVVDANFSTLWPVAANAMSRFALLALINSSWTWANLEATSTVLGGGALKVEATDLRRLPIPDFDAEEIARLDELGGQLRSPKDRDVLDQIDRLVVEAIVGAGESATAIRGLAESAERARQSRST